MTSTYFWDKEDGGIACCHMVKKEVEKIDIEKGSWDSINFIDIKVDVSKKKVTYKITSSVILEMKI